MNHVILQEATAPADANSSRYLCGTFAPGPGKLYVSAQVYRYANINYINLADMT